MRRREFITIVGMAAVWSHAGDAQQAANPVIGFLHSQTLASESTRIAAMKEGLKEAGFVVGRNLTIEHPLRMAITTACQRLQMSWFG